MSGAAGDSRHAANDLNALVQLVQKLAGDENFQNISGQYEEIPRLKGILDAKEQLLERCNGEIEALKAEYGAIYRKNLQLYDEGRDALKAKVRSLREEVDESTKVIAQKNATISRMENEEMQTKKKVGELEKLLKTETQKYDKEVCKAKALENDKFKTQHEMESLEDQLEKKSDRVTELEKTVAESERQTDSLARENGTLLRSLQAIEALATPLDENKLEDS
jgi:chromosome segregation ATPase